MRASPPPAVATTKARGADDVLIAGGVFGSGGCKVFSEHQSSGFPRLFFCSPVFLTPITLNDSSCCRLVFLDNFFLAQNIQLGVLFFTKVHLAACSALASGLLGQLGNNVSFTSGTCTCALHLLTRNERDGKKMHTIAET